MGAEQFLKAISEGDQKAVVEALRVDPGLANVRGPDGSSAIQRACYYGHPELVDVLLDAGAEVDLPTACTIGRIGAISADADPNALSADGFRPLALASAFGHNDVVRLLLQKGADPNLISTALGGVPPLQSAVFGRNLEAVRLMVESGADVNARQAGGFTALMGAAQNGDAPIVGFLLGHGADRSARSNDGKSAADWAANDEVRALLA